MKFKVCKYLDYESKVNGTLKLLVHNDDLKLFWIDYDFSDSAEKSYQICKRNGILNYNDCICFDCAKCSKYNEIEIDIDVNRILV